MLMGEGDILFTGGEKMAGTSGSYKARGHATVHTLELKVEI
jgi:hypothetical protein